MTYPEHDNQYEDHEITKVESFNGSYTVTFDTGWSIATGPDCAIVPEIGMTARLYTRGTIVRGLFIDGQKIWYRTEEQDKEYYDTQLYGADAADWLARWDSGKSVFSIEMGGIGPGYEQCIQITAAELLRWLLDKKPDASFWHDEEILKRDRDELDEYAHNMETLSDLGLSGAQYGAAVNLAIHLYRDGPRSVFTNPDVKDRHIQVSKNFPQGSAEVCVHDR